MRDAFRLARQQDEVIAGLVVVTQNDAGVVLAGLQADAGGRNIECACLLLRFQAGDHLGKAGLRGLDVVEGDGAHWASFESDEWLNWQSADGSGAKLGVAVAEALVADVEVLIPGVVRVGLEERVAPVPVAVELRALMGK